jgi:hypothetical protein
LTRIRRFTVTALVMAMLSTGAVPAASAGTRVTGADEGATTLGTRVTSVDGVQVAGGPDRDLGSPV